MPARKTKRGTNCFQQSWLKTYSWAKKKSETHVTCTLCLSDISFSNMGESALKNHCKANVTKPTKHQRLEAEREKVRNSLSVLHYVDVTKSSNNNNNNNNNNNSNNNSDDDSDDDSNSSSNKNNNNNNNSSSNNDRSSSTQHLQPTLDQYIVPLSLARAEILWAMKVALSHYSLRSCLGISDLFGEMFNDSIIAQQFSMSKTKCGYYINFGLAPYYREKLVSDIKNSPFYTILFDETLNHMVQEEQMDVHIRYWSEESCMVKTSYFDSQFMRRANAENLTTAINNSIQSHGITKDRMIHIGMDGPNTNWLVIKLVAEERAELQLPPVEIIGACGLHIISGALHTGVKESGWLIEVILKAMFKLFSDSPARRDVYIKINLSTTFAERFCATRWVENEPVAERGIDVWDNVVKVVNHYETLSISKRPQKNKSYDNLVKEKDDILVKIKLVAFRDISRRLNVFLIKFQTDAPMVPFLADELQSIMRDLMRYFITKSALEKASTPYKLCKIDVTVKGNNCLPISEIKLPTAVKSMLKKLKLSADQKQSFIKEFRNLLIGMIVKIQERTPLKYPLVRGAASLSPVRMVTKGEESVLLFESLVDTMYEHKRLSSKEGDEVKQQYKSFLEMVVQPNVDKFRNFNFKKDRFDTFMYSFLGGNNDYKLLWKITLFVSILSHGQATIERGFNVNKDVVVENLTKESICCQRLVYDFLKGIENLYEVKTPRELILSCKSAHQRYTTYLTEKKGEQVQSEASNKRKMKMDEVLQVKRARTDLDKAIVTIKNDIEKYCVQAATEESFETMKAELEKANALRETLKKKEESSKELETAIRKLEDELKAIKE